MLKNQFKKNESKKLNQIHKQISKFKKQLEAIDASVIPDEIRTEKQLEKEN